MNRTESFSQMEVTGLQLRLAWATADVMTGDVPQIQIHVAGNEEDVAALRITLEDGKLKIEQPTAGLSYKLNIIRWMQIMVRIPKEWRGNVDAATTTATLRARGLKGSDLSLETLTGSVEAEVLEAMTLKASSITGIIRLGAIHVPQITLKTISGNIHLREAVCEEVHCSSVSGNLELQMTEPFISVDANMVSANLRVTAPVEEADATFHTATGRILTDGVSIRKEGPVVSAVSVSGNVELIRG